MKARRKEKLTASERLGPGPDRRRLATASDAGAVSVDNCRVGEQPRQEASLYSTGPAGAAAPSRQWFFVPHSRIAFTIGPRLLPFSVSRYSTRGGRSL